MNSSIGAPSAFTSSVGRLADPLGEDWGAFVRLGELEAARIAAGLECEVFLFEALSAVWAPALSCVGVPRSLKAVFVSAVEDLITLRVCSQVSPVAARSR